MDNYTDLYDEERDNIKEFEYYYNFYDSDFKCLYDVSSEDFSYIDDELKKELMKKTVFVLINNSYTASNGSIRNNKVLHLYLNKAVEIVNDKNVVQKNTNEEHYGDYILFDDLPSIFKYLFKISELIEQEIDNNSNYEAINKKIK